MLTEADKEDIAREIERERYRSTLTPSKSRQERLWEFLNTSLGLWLLSAVLLSGLTAGTAQLVDWLHKRSELDKQQVALHDELLVRYMRMYTADGFQNAEQFGLFFEKNEDQYLSIFLKSRQAPRGAPGSIYSERDTADLFLEVERTTSDPNVKRLAQNVWKTAAYADTVARVGHFSDPHQRAQRIASRLSEIRRYAGDLVYALGYRGSFAPSNDKYEPTFSPSP